MIDADVAAAIASGNVDPGITAEYLNESRDEPAIIAIIVITIIVSIVLLLRCFSRVFIVKSFGIDDWLALISYTCFIAFVALCFILIGEGSGRHIEYIQYVLTQSQTNQTEVNDYAAHLIYTAALFLCRLSGLAFFYRLCARHQQFLLAVRVAAVFLFCAFLPQFFLILAHCRPVTGLWPYAWQPNIDRYTCVTWGTVYVTNSGLSLVCDLIIFTIPAAMIWLLKLSRGRKIMLAMLLMPGVMVIGISIARLYLCVVGQWASDGSWYYDPQLVIEVSEVGGTLMALSIPSLKPLFAVWYNTMRSTANSTFRHTEPADVEELALQHSRSDAGLVHPKAHWPSDHYFNRANVKTSVRAESSIVKDSSRGSYDDDINLRDIMVHMEVDQHSIASISPMERAAMKS
ncbi:hypothetical protein AAFC00_001675 [Neodothiora populina]|uniref:Rhodopsin domain-containing protein n=1 Tax=Neodothiora populina TaxID=2781224 RepID=A0ABR3PPS0_9PEZI